MRVGVWFYGLATVVTGILDIVWGAFEASHQPIQSSAYSWRTCTRVPRGCVAGRGWHGDLVATYRTDGKRGISRGLPYLCLVLAASVYVYDAEVWFSHRVSSFSSWAGSVHRYCWPPRQPSFTPRLHPRRGMARESSDRCSLDVGTAPHLLRFRAPRQSSRLRPLRPALGCRLEIFG